MHMAKIWTTFCMVGYIRRTSLHGKHNGFMNSRFIINGTNSSSTTATESRAIQLKFIEREEGKKKKKRQTN